jgi:predicted transcriptional regulator of viral defense system
MGKHAQSIDSQVLRRAKAGKEGWVFTAKDFLDLGSRDAVDKALSRQSRGGFVRKIARGLYDIPRRDAQLGQLAPSVDAIAKAFRDRDAIRLQPSGAYAANLLGLSDQVPMKVVFLTDGSARRIQVGKLQIILKRTTPRNMATAGEVSGLVIQALRHLGQRGVGAREIAVLRRRLTAADRRRLLKDARFAPAWVGRLMRDVAEPAKE